MSIVVLQALQMYLMCTSLLNIIVLLVGMSLKTFTHSFSLYHNWLYLLYVLLVILQVYICIRNNYAFKSFATYFTIIKLYYLIILIRLRLRLRKKLQFLMSTFYNFMRICPHRNFIKRFESVPFFNWLWSGNKKFDFF